MRDRPHGAELLAIARQVLARDVVPALAAEQRVLGLMVTRAIEIAERESAAGLDSLRSYRAALSAFYGEVPPPIESEKALHAALLRLDRRLAADLRADIINDPEKLQAIYALLLAERRARVAETNPRYLRED